MAVLDLFFSSHAQQPWCSLQFPRCRNCYTHYCSNQRTLQLLKHKTLRSQSCKINLLMVPPLSSLQARGTTTQEEVSADCSSAKRQMPSDVVKEFYEKVNSRTLEGLHDLIAENCVYEDFIYPKPFKGRQAVLSFFKKFMDSLSKDLKFVIDDISKDDSAVVAVAWHLEWRGRYFPFSKGCSFYRCDVLDGKTQIVYGRDSVEPATKPGDFALVAIKAVTALLEQFPVLAERL